MLEREPGPEDAVSPSNPNPSPAFQGIPPYLGNISPGQRMGGSRDRKLPKKHKKLQAPVSATRTDCI